MFAPGAKFTVPITPENPVPVTIKLALEVTFKTDCLLENSMDAANLLVVANKKNLKANKKNMTITGPRSFLGKKDSGAWVK